MDFALATIWYERQRFLPAILAVSFSAILMVVQGGLVVGLLSMMSVPVDKATSDVWIGSPGVKSVDLGQKIPERWIARVANQPEVVRAEPQIISFSMWTPIDRNAPPSSPAVCLIVGCKLDKDSIGAVEELRNNPELMVKLTEPNTIVVDESELGRLGVKGVATKAKSPGGSSASSAWSRVTNPSVDRTSFAPSKRPASSPANALATARTCWPSAGRRKTRRS